MSVFKKYEGRTFKPNLEKNIRYAIWAVKNTIEANFYIE